MPKWYGDGIHLTVAHKREWAYSFKPDNKTVPGNRMQELKAKWVFEQGGFAKALIACAPMGIGYHLHLVKFGRNNETEIIERQRGGWR